LYSYTSGDWSSLFEQRPKLIGPELYDIYHRLLTGGDPGAEVAGLNALESEARVRLADALFLLTGKLNQAAQALAETPLPVEISSRGMTSLPHGPHVASRGRSSTDADPIRGDTPV